MLSEALSIEQYPAINWSRVVKIHDDGWEEFGYGLTRIRIIGGQFWELHKDGMITPRPVKETEDTAAYFGVAGQIPVTRVFSENNYPFNLEDAIRINKAGELTRQFLLSFQQIVASRNIIQQSDRFFNTLRPLNLDDPALIEQIGVLKKKAEDQIHRVLPLRSIEIAARLKELQIKEFGEAGFKAGLWTPDWVIERFPQLTY